VNSEATGKALDLVGKEGVGGRLSDQPFDRGAVAGVCACLGEISLRDAGARPRDVGKATNLERIALADQQRAAAVAREVAGLRLENSVRFAMRASMRGPILSCREKRIRSLASRRAIGCDESRTDA
jgi:hypothetical protein